jgi:hypothetical protein
MLVFLQQLRPTVVSLCVFCYNFFQTLFLTHEYLCNTQPGSTREDKVASLDANHLKAWQAVAAMMPKPQMLKYHDAFL